MRAVCWRVDWIVFPKCSSVIAETLDQLLAKHRDERELPAEVAGVETVLKEHVGEDVSMSPQAVKNVRNFIRSR